MFDRVLVFNCETGGAVVTNEALGPLITKGSTVTSSLQDAIKNVESARFYVPILVASSFSVETQKFFQSCSSFLNGLNDYFVLVTTDPDPQLQGAAYEMGIRNVWSADNLATKIISWIESIDAKTKVEGSAESMMYKLAVAVARTKRGNRSSDIDTYIAKLKEDSVHDYRIAFLLGQATQAVQQFDQAEKYFAKCIELNPNYIPAVVSHAQLKLQNASPADAFKVLEKLEKLNGANCDRKALLAAASADSGNWENARKYLAEAEKLEPANSRVKEMKVRVAFESGNVTEALTLLDMCDQIDEYFITKLNDQAIGLAKNGKTQDALNLYHKAHALASNHIKYKISYNIALAYKRQNEFAKALEMPDTVDKEVGSGGFEKATKLRQQIKEEMAKR